MNQNMAENQKRPRSEELCRRVQIQNRAFKHIIKWIIEEEDCAIEIDMEDCAVPIGGHIPAQRSYISINSAFFLKKKVM